MLFPSNYNSIDSVKIDNERSLLLSENGTKHGKSDKNNGQNCNLLYFVIGMISLVVICGLIVFKFDLIGNFGDVTGGATGGIATGGDATELTKLQSEELSDSLSFDSDGSSYHWMCRGMISELNSGDIVSIRAFRGGIFKTQSGTNKIRSVEYFADNGALWTVGYNSNKGYTFKNKANNCYLKHADGFLKCLSTLDDKSYWKDSAVTNAWDDGSDPSRVYTKLLNYGNNKCPDVVGCDKDSIDMDSNACSTKRSWVYFEVVSDNPFALEEEKEEKEKEQENGSINSLTNWSYRWTASGNLDKLDTGDVITIRSFYGGLLKSKGKNSKIGVDSVLEGNKYLWTVGYDSSKNAYSFYNNAHSCYLAEENNWFKCRGDSSAGNKIYWKKDSTTRFVDDSSDYRRFYTIIKNYKANECGRILSCNQDSVPTRASGGGTFCGWGLANAFSFEIVA